MTRPLGDKPKRWLIRTKGGQYFQPARMAIAIAIENCLLDWPAQVMAAGRSGEKAVTSRQLGGVYVDPMDLDSDAVG